MAEGLCQACHQVYPLRGGICDKCSTYQRFWIKVNKAGPLPDGVVEGPCWLWLGAEDPDHYGIFRWGGHTGFAHRYAYKEANGAITSEVVVRHGCDRTLCVRPSHLIAGSVLDNVRDRCDRGRTARGASIASARLTDLLVLWIRYWSATDVPVSEIAKRCSAQSVPVSDSTIRNVIARRTWAHVQ